MATENVGVSPLIPLAAGLILAMFTISLAMAEPRGNSSLMAAHDFAEGSGLSIGGGLASDALPPEDTVISSRTLQPPRHPDRYEFYHRYDSGLTSRYRADDQETR